MAESRVDLGAVRCCIAIGNFYLRFLGIGGVLADCNDSCNFYNGYYGIKKTI